jgi:hypothetical protein
MQTKFFFLFLLASLELLAQNQTPKPEFNPQTFKPALGASNLLMTEGARIEDHLGYTIAGFLHYQLNPYTIVEAHNGLKQPLWSPVIHKFMLNLLGSLTLYKFIQVGLDLPFSLYQQGEEISLPDLNQKQKKTSAGIEDPRINIKTKIKEFKPWDITLAFSPSITLPLGNSLKKHQFLGEKNVTFHPKINLDLTKINYQLGINLGYKIRENSSYFSTKAGDEFTYAIGGAYIIKRKYKAIIEILGANGFSTSLDENPLELLLGIEIHFNKIIIQGAIGTGIISAVGVPQFRGLVCFRYIEVNIDRDQDRVLDIYDRCLLQREDLDDFQDEDGCPEPDNDRDGWLDEEDKCPFNPEDKDRFQDRDGCPDPDNDKDKINDIYDSCPLEPEDYDRFQDQDGCPDPDNDKDKVLDVNDQCLFEPEDIDGFEDQDGCPDPDNDKDKILDIDDHCPQEPEDIDEFEDEDGCPDPGEHELDMDFSKP